MKSPTRIPLTLCALAFIVAPAAAQKEDPKEPVPSRASVPATPLIQPGQAKPAEKPAQGVPAAPLVQPENANSGATLRMMPTTQPGAAIANGATAPDAGAMAFTALEQEFAAAYGAWMRKVQELRGTGEEYPPQPQADFYPRFRKLADAGNIDARVWCLSNFADCDTTPEQFRAAAWRGEALSLATALRDDPEAVSPLIRALGGGNVVDGVGNEGVQEVYAYIDGTSASDSVKATLLATRASNAEWSRDPEMKAQAAGLYEELLAKYPDSPQAARAKGKIFAANNLQVGQTPPNFSGKSEMAKPST